MLSIGLLVAASFVVYGGFFYLLALALQMGTPLDAVWAGLYRGGLGLAATMVALVIHVSMRLSYAAPETIVRADEGVAWVLRIALWAWVLTWVYRVTRWRKGKLAIGMAAGLAFNFGVDFILRRLGDDFMPAFGSWVFRLC
jgi:hypothetical protein